MFIIIIIINYKEDKRIRTEPKWVHEIACLKFKMQHYWKMTKTCGTILNTMHEVTPQ